MCLEVGESVEAESERRRTSNCIIFILLSLSLSSSLSPHLFARRPRCSCSGHDGFRVHLEEVCERVHRYTPRRLEGVSRDRKKNFPSENLCFENMVLPLLFFRSRCNACRSFLLFFLSLSLLLRPHVVVHRRGRAAGTHEHDPGRAQKQGGHLVSERERRRGRKRNQKNLVAEGALVFPVAVLATASKGLDASALAGREMRCGPGQEEESSFLPLERSTHTSSIREERGREKELLLILLFSSPIASVRSGEVRPLLFLNLNRNRNRNRTLPLNPPPPKPHLDNNSTDSRKIKNPTLRSCFDGAVDLGADAAAKVERFWESVSK